MFPIGPVEDIQIALAVIAGVLSSVIAAVAARPDLPSNHKRLISGIITTVFGIFAAVVSGGIHGFPTEWQDIAISFGLYIAGAIVVAQTFYAQFKPLLDRLSAATSPGYTPRRAVNEGEDHAVSRPTVERAGEAAPPSAGEGEGTTDPDPDRDTAPAGGA